MTNRRKARAKAVKLANQYMAVTTVRTMPAVIRGKSKYYIQLTYVIDIADNDGNVVAIVWE